ncbi:hypothetical protein [Marinobacter salarius]|uniref:hypothetical protein n=1 Tax=Marinobacter salarius TaxID=1420917 RepID=UPI003BAA739E
MQNKKIHVLDMLPGSGKSTSAIDYIQRNPQKKIILVCELLTEIERYCDQANLVTPVHKYQKNKSESVKELLSDNQSIAITHALLLKLDHEAIQMISHKGYELIIDEVMAPFIKESNYTPNDFKTLLKRGVIDVDSTDGTVSYLLPELPDTKYRALKDAADTGQLIAVPETGQLLHRLPVNVFSAAKKVTIMTYMFDGSLLDTYLRKRDFSIEKSDLKVMKDQEQYRKQIAECINLKENKVIDSIVNTYKVVNVSQYHKNDKIGSRNFFNKIDKECRENKLSKGSTKNNLAKVIASCARQSDASANDVMYSVFKRYATVEENKLSNGGYPNHCIRPHRLSAQSCFVPISARGTNNYAHKSVAICCVNLFLDPNFKKFLNHYYEDVYIDDDKIAISSLLQWLFRGCVRNGKPMDVYVLSERMKKLLIDWLNGEI